MTPHSRSTGRYLNNNRSCLIRTCATPPSPTVPLTLLTQQNSPILPAASILVTGVDGQVGRSFRQLATLWPQYDFHFVNREQLAITDLEAVYDFFSTHAFTHCINCAAYTAVDKAETATAEAFSVNATGVGNLASACAAAKARLIHISTDYVFDGSATVPYTETHPTSPINVYGASKLKGEELALQINPNSYIIRTSWVYAPQGNNFVNTMLKLMKEKESIRVVNDQWGSPTYAPDLASAILQMMGQPGNNDAQQIFNYCNIGITNWYEFALAIKKLSGSTCNVSPIPSSEYPTAAKRPMYSVLDTTLIQQAFGLDIPSWHDALKRCISS